LQQSLHPPQFIQLHLLKPIPTRALQPGVKSLALAYQVLQINPNLIGKQQMPIRIGLHVVPVPAAELKLTQQLMCIQFIVLKHGDHLLM
jgi:hypothetical protein